MGNSEDEERTIKQICRLKDREREILILIGKGKTRSEIAKGLTLSEEAVRGQIRTMRRVLGLEGETWQDDYKAIREEYAPLLGEIIALGRFLDEDVMGAILENGYGSLEFSRSKASWKWVADNSGFSDEIVMGMLEMLPDNIQDKLLGQPELEKWATHDGDIPPEILLGLLGTRFRPKFKIRQALLAYIDPNPSPFRLAYGIDRDSLKPRTPELAAKLEVLRNGWKMAVDKLRP